MTHHAAKSFSNSFHSPFHRAGGRTSCALQQIMPKFTAIAVALVAVLIAMWQASVLRIKFGRSHAKVSWFGSDESYRESAVFEIQTKTGVQWLRSIDLTTAVAIIGPDLPGDQIGSGWTDPQSPRPVWKASLWRVTEDRESDDLRAPGITVQLEFDYASRTVTVLKTGERLEFSPNLIYVVHLEKDYTIRNIAAMDRSGRLQQASPAVSDDFHRFVHQVNDRPEQEGAGRPLATP